MEIPIIGQTGQEGFYPVNFYFHPELENGGAGLVGTPGYALWSTVVAAGGIVRGLWDMDGVLYAVVGSAVYYFTGTTAVACTGALLTTTGSVQMVDNGTQIMIVDGLHGYYVSAHVVTEIADADFIIPTSLTFQDGYGIVTESGTGKIWISGINDFTTWDALDYTTAEAEPDDAIGLLSDHREIWVFGSQGTETYYNSGNADFPFERIAGGYIERGIGAALSPVKADNAIIWLSDKKQVIKTMGPGQSPQVISTPQLHKEFEGYASVSDAFAWPMDFGGFTWYVINFPTGNKTWVYNLATGRWHQWASFSAGTDIRHPANCYVYHSGKHLIGHWQDGCLYEVNSDYYTNNGNTFRSIARFPTVIKEGKRIFHHKLQMDFKAGVGLVSGSGSDPQAMLRWSDDRMRTWSNEHWASIGKIGEYGSRAIWRRLGQAFTRNYEVSITDPIERVIYGVYLNPDMEDDLLRKRERNA